MNSNFPKNLHSGDTFLFEDLFDDYGALTFNATYILMNNKNKYIIEGGIEKENNKFKVSLSSALTETFEPGEYLLNIVFKSLDDTIKRTFAVNKIKILENISTAEVKVEKSWAQKALDNIRAVLSNTATPNQKSYEFDGRKLESFSLKELLEAESMLKDRVRQEINEASGRGKGVRITSRVKGLGGF